MNIDPRELEHTSLARLRELAREHLPEKKAEWVDCLCNEILSKFGEGRDPLIAEASKLGLTHGNSRLCGNPRWEYSGRFAMGLDTVEEAISWAAQIAKEKGLDEEEKAFKELMGRGVCENL